MDTRMLGAAFEPAKQLFGSEFRLDPTSTQIVDATFERLLQAAGSEQRWSIAVLADPYPDLWQLPGRKIALSVGLLWKLRSESELAALLARSIAHEQSGHARTVMQTNALRVLSSGRDGLASRSSAAEVMGPVAAAAAVLRSPFTLQSERAADAKVLTLLQASGYNPHAALVIEERLAKAAADGIYSWQFGLLAHYAAGPTRVADLRRLLRDAVPEDIQDQQPFRQQTAYLRRLNKAYAAWSEGSLALDEGRFDIALEQASKALDLEPRGARFHQLRGRTYHARDDFKEALTHFQRAVGRNGNYYAYYLERGITYYDLGQLDEAREDLQQSISLLPTATAQYYLANIARRSGKQQLALNHYRQAATLDSPMGRQAELELTHLDFPLHPERYVELRAELNFRNQLQLRIINTAPFAVRNLRVQVRDGERHWNLRFRESVTGNAEALRDTQLGPYTEAELLNLQLLITAAAAVE